MTPYYSDDAVTIWHGDCREVAMVGDALVTDPPYGVRLGTGDERRGTGRLYRSAYHNYTDTYEDYCSTVVPVVSLLIGRTKRAAVFVGPHYQEMPKADTIGGIFYPSAVGRTGWGFKTFLPIFLYGAAPRPHLGSYPTSMISNHQSDVYGHPCAKPIEWMRWLIGLATEPGDVVLDPFAGTGSTLRAAKDLGRKAVGVEIEERYCEIAAKRLGQEVLDFGAAA